ncbi:MAG TPA: PSD1 and planctomycete cytochrome C domain-containing protein [Bryobacteraceae bacterium]|jgi:cytochrome c553
MRTAIIAATISVALQANAASLQFEKDIAPILQQACGKCHLGDMAMGKLKLDSPADILRGGASGPAIVAGKSADSLLVKRILGLTDAPRMPMGGDPLPAEQVKLIRAWIDQGKFDASQMSPVENAGAKPEAGKQSSLFAEQVRPIFAARCYSCHGPDVQQNGLRLDSLAAILKGSESGKVVTAGRSQDSRLVRRLLAQERPQMPYGGPPLSGAEVATIRRWIDAGAPGPDSTAPIAATKPLRHWAYVKPVRPPLPQVADAAWCRNPIDRFVLAKLEREGLKPSPEAPKSTLLRRVYLDLTGLPPSPQEVDEFVADESPNAYEKVVDRLLASPHYGERWARPWLDLARYADSNGYEKDSLRIAWEYRDWVIRALNQDMSFRDFTIDQIAGDMLPHPTKDQLIATGFHRNSMLNQEGGIDIDEYYWYSLVDRVNTTALVWLGSTLGCAQCHNHKFDPYTQKDYYRFMAFFSNSEHESVGKAGSDHWMGEPELELPTPEQLKRSKAIRAQMARLQEALDTSTPQLEASQKAWEEEVPGAETRWSVLTPVRYESAGGATLKLLPDQSILASGNNPQADTYRLTAETHLPSITGIRLEVLPDASLPKGGPGRDSDGNFFLSDFDVEVAPLDNPAAKRPIVWKSAVADESQRGYYIKNLIDKKAGQLSGWAIDASSDVPIRRQAVLLPEEAISSPGGSIFSITMKHQMRHSSRNIGRFRLSVTSSTDPEFIVQIPARLRLVLSIPADRRTPDQSKSLAEAYREVAPSLEVTHKELAALKITLRKVGIVTAMVMAEQPGFTRPAAYIRERGSFASKGELVYADVPSSLGSLPRNAMPNRLGLAEWLVSDDNPLTARVTVNHFWETLFGHGIVETSEDFGTQGDPPSHPELLDWLATEFTRNGWSMKKIQRMMVTSATYRQDSRVTPELTSRDPYNKLYARGPRFQVEAEMIHDLALSESGLLSGKMYGPSVFPYQPEGVWDIPYSSDKWVQSQGADQYRRAIYTFLRRSAPYPSLVTYDAPSREFCTVRRVRTDTPLQALTGLNDPYFFTAARAMAKRMAAEGGKTPAEQIAYGFRLTVARRPSQKELDRVLKFYNQQLREAPQLALTMVANVLMNMDETITKE